MSKATFTMEPFTCPSCVKKIERTVAKVDGVEDVRVMFNSGRVKVEFNDSKTTVETVQDTMVRLGYPVLSVKVS